MSLKSIEMQVAIPRTIESSKLQEQIQLRGQIMNGLANDAVQKEVEQKRTAVIENEKSTKTQLDHKNKEHQGKDPNEHFSEKKILNDQHQATHPYKGKMIDYSG